MGDAADIYKGKMKHMTSVSVPKTFQTSLVLLARTSPLLLEVCVDQSRHNVHKWQ